MVNIRTICYSIGKLKENGCLRLYPNISTVIYASARGKSLIGFSEVRRNTRIQTEQQLYMNILSSSYSLWNNETISKIAKESPEISSYLALVDTPEEYNNISAIIDFLNFYFVFTRQKCWIRSFGTDGKQVPSRL